MTVGDPSRLRELIAICDRALIRLEVEGHVYATTLHHDLERVRDNAMRELDTQKTSPAHNDDQPE